jgi:hypothetical protein
VTVPYEDALQQVLEAVRSGHDLEAAVARFPEHAVALREDVRLSEGVTRLSRAVASPPPEARAAASRRMLSQLAAERTAAAKPRASFLGLGWPRYVLAAAVVAIAVLGAGLLLGGGGATVEAATIEGVVVENEGGTLTVQTLDALEQVEVPGDALVSDVAGASIGLGGIEVGQVVVINAERRGRQVVAQRVQRFKESLEAWCTDDSARCRALTAELEKAKMACQRAPATCRVALERLEALRLRALDSAKLEELKQACRGGDSEACRLIVTFCRDHIALCGALAPGEPPITDRPLLENRLKRLLAACDAGDDAACRQVAAGCDRFADLCPIDQPVAPGPSSTPTGAPRPNTSSSDGTPAVPPATSDARPQDEATPARPVETQPAPGAPGPTVTPVRDEPVSLSTPDAGPPRNPSATPGDGPSGDRPR